MKKTLPMMSLLLLICLTGYCQISDTALIKKVLSDFSRNSYFISIKVSSSNGVSSYVVKNDDLYYYFNQVKGCDKAEYGKIAASILLSGRALKLSTADIKKYRFVKISMDSDALKYRDMGKSAFLKNYFTENILKKHIGRSELFNVVSILYSWKIASRIDDETGYLVIEK